MRFSRHKVWWKAIRITLVRWLLPKIDVTWDVVTRYMYQTRVFTSNSDIDKAEIYDFLEKLTKTNKIIVGIKQEDVKNSRTKVTVTYFDRSPLDAMKIARK